jgi:hypothetical protein
MYVYIHGLNSNGKRTASLLEKCLDEHVVRLEWHCDRPFDENIAYLLYEIEELENKMEDFENIVIIGSGIGGYYAAAASVLNYYHCVLFNPVINPKKTLLQFKGLNRNLSTGKTYELTEELINSYNFSEKLNKHGISRYVVLGRNDTVIGYREAEEFYKDRSFIEITDDGHYIKNYEPYAKEISSMKYAICYVDPDEL